VRVGLYFDLRNPARWRREPKALYDRAMRVCVEADRLGLHALWFTEHHGFDDGYLPQPLIFAAAAAARTEHIRIGTSILIAGIRPAALIAEEAAVVDIISGGRLELGLGAGYREPEFSLYDTDGRRRHQVMFERIEQIRLLWEQGQVTPAPIQARVPIWVGATGPRTARRTGEIGEGLMRISQDLVGPYRAGLTAAGHVSGGRIAGPANLYLSDDPERDWRVVREHVGYQWSSYARYRADGTGKPVDLQIDPDEWRARGLTRGLMNGFMLATPAEAAVTLRATAGAIGADAVYLWATLPGLPDALVDRHVALTAELSSLLSARSSERSSGGG
jgi:alkanesulfonate monooxygenase SsuD/methylene tetrahydromethanopterin reductase-like flavin-dependent oxidoreductase (luciferase family)